MYFSDAVGEGPTVVMPSILTTIVIAVAFALVGYWFGKKDWYRSRISVPASTAIACVGAWWVVERVFL